MRQHTMEAMHSSGILQGYVNAVAVVPAAHSGPSHWLGLAVYPRAAMLNHACLPTVSASFSGLQLQVHALEDLPPSSTLRLCYGPQVPSPGLDDIHTCSRHAKLCPEPSVMAHKARIASG